MSYEDLFESVEITSNVSRSSNFDKLSIEQQHDVTDFVSYLKNHTSFTQNSVNSYKSNITKALLKFEDNIELTNDEKSAVRKFKKFMS
jgi:hypothetical protein